MISGKQTGWHPWANVSRLTSASGRDQLTRMSESINIAEYIHTISGGTKLTLLTGANTAVMHPGTAALSVSIKARKRT